MGKTRARRTQFMAFYAVLGVVTKPDIHVARCILEVGFRNLNIGPKKHIIDFSRKKVMDLRKAASWWFSITGMAALIFVWYVSGSINKLRRGGIEICKNCSISDVGPWQNGKTRIGKKLENKMEKNLENWENKLETWKQKWKILKIEK